MSCRTIQIDDPDLGCITAHVRLGGPMTAEDKAALGDVIREAARQLWAIRSSASGKAASKEPSARRGAPSGPARNPGFSRNTKHETRITAF